MVGTGTEEFCVLPEMGSNHATAELDVGSQSSPEADISAEFAAIPGVKRNIFS